KTSRNGRPEENPSASISATRKSFRSCQPNFRFSAMVGRITDLECASQENAMEKIVKTEAQWKQQLTREQFEVTRRHGTERAFSGKYHATKESGMYECVCCAQPLFASETTFDSGTGWPGVWQPVTSNAVTEKE